MWKKSNQYSQQNQKLKKNGSVSKSICTKAKQNKNKRQFQPKKKKPFHKKKKVNPTENA